MNTLKKKHKKNIIQISLTTLSQTLSVVGLCMVFLLSASNPIHGRLDSGTIFGGPSIGYYTFGHGDYGSSLYIGGTLEKYLDRNITLHTKAGIIRAINTKKRDNQTGNTIDNTLSLAGHISYSVYPHKRNMVYINGGLHYQTVDKGFAPLIGAGYFIPVNERSHARLELNLGRDMALTAFYSQQLDGLSDIYRKYSKIERVKTPPERGELITPKEVKEKEIIAKTTPKRPEKFVSPLLTKLRERIYAKDHKKELLSSLTWLGFTIKEVSPSKKRAVNKPKYTIDHIHILPSQNKNKPVNRFEASEMAMLLYNPIQELPLSPDKEQLLKIASYKAKQTHKKNEPLSEPIITRVLSYSNDHLIQTELSSGPLYGVLYSAIPKSPPFIKFTDIPQNYASYKLILQSIDKKFMSFYKTNKGVQFKSTTQLKKIHLLILLGRVMSSLYRNPTPITAPKTSPLSTIKWLSKADKNNIFLLQRELRLQSIHMSNLNATLSRKEFVLFVNLFIDWKSHFKVPTYHNQKHTIITGSFRSFNNANAVKEDLQLQLIDPIIIPAIKKGKLVYQVQAKSFQKIDEAKSYLKMLQQRGIKGYIYTKTKK